LPWDKVRITVTQQAVILADGSSDATFKEDEGPVFPSVLWPFWLKAPMEKPGPAESLANVLRPFFYLFQKTHRTMKFLPSLVSSACLHRQRR
jgi:hypothetical protein